MRKASMKATARGLHTWDPDHPDAVIEVNFGLTSVAPGDYDGKAIDMQAVPFLIEALQGLKAGYDRARNRPPAPDPDARIAELEQALREQRRWHENVMQGLERSYPDKADRAFAIMPHRISIERIDAILNTGSDTNAGADRR